MKTNPAIAGDDEALLPLYAVRPAGSDRLLNSLPTAQAAFLQAQGFAGAAGALVLLPGEAGLAGAVLGLGDVAGPSAFGGLALGLPAATGWRFASLDGAMEEAALGFLLGAYDDRRFKAGGRAPARLAAEQATPRVRAVATAINLARDLINTPPNLLGPADLAAAAASLAADHGAAAETVIGAKLTARFPALAAVGAGSDRAPAAVIFTWAGSRAGADARHISLCGKGVCFDTGGYDLKPSGAMLRMKKDMGGAAILLGLAHAIMALDLPVRLTVRVGCVENSVSGHAMRPSDVIATRAGKTVEVGNTDAEGRLVLCDLLAEAVTERPDWLIDAATLTGAARVALGPDLPALFCNQDDMAARLLDAGVAAGDPLWRLPLFTGYDSWLDSPVADLNNVSSKPLAGAIVAALFLRRFVPEDVPWAHIDVYAWNDANRPGRPEGGEAQSLRALLAAVEAFA